MIFCVFTIIVSKMPTLFIGCDTQRNSIVVYYWLRLRDSDNDFHVMLAQVYSRRNTETVSQGHVFKIVFLRLQN